MKSRPVLIAFSVLAGTDVLLGGAALGEVVDVKWIGLAALVQAAVSAGLGYYVHGQVAPWPTVAVVEPEPGLFVAGKAGPVREGKQVEPPVEAGPSPYRSHDVDLR